MSRTITDLREILFNAMEDLSSGKIDVEKAKQIANLGQVVVKSAVAEVKLISREGGRGTGFISEEITPIKQLPKTNHREETLSEHEKTLRKYGV
jgi:hypothetical protein